VSPSGPVTQDRTARRLRAVVDAEDCAHQLAGVRNFFPPWLFPSVSFNRSRSARGAASPPIGLSDRPIEMPLSPQNPHPAT
jgi:hypothetical protein